MMSTKMGRDMTQRSEITEAPLGPAPSDLVNHPPHYTAGKIECLDFILDQDLPYLAGQVVKYVVRYRHKGTPRQDLEKAEFYLKRLLKELE